MTMIFNFFATSDELIALWHWIAEMPGMRFIETSSRPGLPNREFDGYPAEELAAANRDFGVEAWPSNAGGTPAARYVNFEPETAKKLGSPGRTNLTSPAIFNIHSALACDEMTVGPNELAFWTEKLAARSTRFSPEEIAAVDWRSHRNTITEIKKHIRKAAVANWRATPVSAGVAHHLERTGAKLWLWGATGTI